MGWKKWSSQDLRGSDTIDSRDVIERLEELESEVEDLNSDIERAQTALDAAQTALDAAQTAFDAARDDEAVQTALEDAQDTRDHARDGLDSSKIALDEWKSDRQDELDALRALAEEGEAECSDWAHGETLIREDCFAEYAKQFADDIGAIDRNAKWPLNHIDWDAAADELRGDYTELTFDGETYLARP
jgi:hypothetical protein